MTNESICGWAAAIRNVDGRDDIEFVLQNNGFDTLTYGVVDVNNPNGPAMFLLASRD